MVGLFAIIFFTLTPDPRPTNPNKFIVGIINPNKGTKAIQQSFINSLKKHASQKNWEISFVKCEKEAEIDNALKQMIADKTDLIFTITTPATLKMKEMTKVNKVPGIYAIFNPVKSGVIKDLAHPGEPRG